MNTKMLTTVAAMTAAAVFSGSAHAVLTGTPMTISVNHAGTFSALSALNNQSYTYGDATGYAVPGWGSVTITAPGAAGYDNAVKLDFTAFNYSAFAGAFSTTGTAKIQNLAENFDLASVHVLVNGLDMTTARANVSGGFTASWNTGAIFGMNPTTPYVVVAWNSLVPAPGSCALLGLAGLVARRGRKRSA